MTTTTQGLIDHLASQMAGLRQAGTYKEELVLQSAQGPRVQVGGRELRPVVERVRHAEGVGRSPGLARRRARDRDDLRARVGAKRRDLDERTEPGADHADAEPCHAGILLE